MIFATTLESALPEPLPTDVQARLADLAVLLTHLANQQISSEDLQLRIAADTTLAGLLRGLIGQQLHDGQQTLRFLLGEHSDSVVIDVGGDQIGARESSGFINRPANSTITQTFHQQFTVVLPQCPGLSVISGFIPPELFAQLNAIVTASTWPRRVLVRAYLACTLTCHRHIMVETEPRQALASIIKHLAQFTTPRTFPLLEFVERLARDEATDFSVMPQLNAWVNDAAAALGLSQAVVVQLRDQVVNSSGPTLPTNPCLLLAIIPAVQRNRFCVQAWIWTDQYASCLEVDDTPRSLPSISRLLDQILTDISGDPTVPMDRLSIGFLLPSKLLFTDIESWKIDIGQPVPLGTQYPVFVRSLDRIYQERFKKTWSMWERKWMASPASRQAGTSTLTRVCWFDSTGSAANLLDQLPHILCLTMLIAPPEITEQQRQAIVDALISAGTPIAVAFKRTPAVPADVRALLEPLLHHPNLPHALFEERQRAARNHVLFGQPITILWDNPHQRPHIPRLRPPR